MTCHETQEGHTMNDYDSGPAVRRSTSDRNFVAPAAPLATRQPVTIDAGPAWLAERPPLDVGRAWQPLQAAQEKTSAMDRAQALRVRLQPFLWAWGAVGVVVGGAVWLVAGALPVGALLAALTFAGLTAVTYYRLNRTDYDYSGAGVERHRVNAAADLARLQMENDHELRRLALASYLAALERHEGKR
jgi:hypothetical protein